ncbi:hypothetical protein GOODEAATRI_031084 [Goodea atripinnis]|uniref:Sterile alpha motif domain-containing 3-like n=1 Tax=Goodea atripinnis TaxID=208336 RepID=A0ABV0P953_9TELE
MIVAYGSTSWLPEFGQIDHIFVIQERLVFAVKRLSGLYSEHHRAFELIACPTKETDLIEFSNLADDYPLADYFVGSLRMVTLKRHKLQFMDADFGNEFTNLTSISEIEDKSTIKLIFDSGLPSDTPPPPYSAPSTSRSGDDSSLSSGSVDTDILSSPDSAASRSSGWPVVFVVPRFPYDCELQLEKANAAFKATGTLLDPDIRLKTAILDSLAEAIVQHKVYPTDGEFEEAAEALVSSHPCLREPGSATGYVGWKVSLKYKLANYRRKLKRLGCPEVELNSLTNKPADKSSPAYGVKKPRKAEVNYCPSYPSGESAETLEKIREALISEAKKRNNEDTVAAMMAKTFSHRRQEVIRDAPMIAIFKTRWPALFSVREVTE